MSASFLNDSSVWQHTARSFSQSVLSYTADHHESRRVTADELLAQAKANGYKTGTNKDKDGIRGAGKHVKRPRMIRMQRRTAMADKVCIVLERKQQRPQ